MKKIIGLIFLLVGIISHGADTATIKAYAEVLPDLELVVTPDPGALAEGIGAGVTGGLLSFGTLVQGEARTTYANETGVGGTQAVVSIERPYVDLTDQSRGFEKTVVEFEIEDAANAGFGLVTLTATGQTDMIADLVVTKDEDGTTKVETTNVSIEEGKGTSTLAMKSVSAGKYLIEVAQGTDADKKVSPKFFVHSELEGTDTAGMSGNFEGNVNVRVRYSRSENSWLN